MIEERAYFTKEMKQTHTILVPTMLPIHFGIFVKMMQKEGYNIKVLDNMEKTVIDEGLKSVHNDTCYPALLVIGQLLDGIKNCGIPREKLAVMISQTGGGCRASNYLYLLCKALKKSGYGDIPVISLSFFKDKFTEGFSLSPVFFMKAAYSCFVADLIMLLGNQCRPYEINKGQTRALEEELTRETADFFGNRPKSWKSCKKLMVDIIKRFDRIPRRQEKRVKVGIVGEIYVKYSPLGNNNLEDFLIEEGCEAVCPGFLDFALYCIYNGIVDYEFYGMNKKTVKFRKWILKKANILEEDMVKLIKENSHFDLPIAFAELPKKVENFISPGVKMGEGWLLTAEMAELIENGVGNIICTQPFGCLPNHVAGKGMMRSLKQKYPHANIAAIDYDSGASKVNQQNRIKLMIENAKLEMREREEREELVVESEQRSQQRIAR